MLFSELQMANKQMANNFSQFQQRHFFFISIQIKHTPLKEESLDKMWVSWEGNHLAWSIYVAVHKV